MIVKDTRYWKTHKEVWIKSFDDLDKAIQFQITNDPQCREARLLEKRVASKVNDALEINGVTLATEKRLNQV